MVGIQNNMNPVPLIALTTDFGTSDTYVGQMKGVIWGINPLTKIVDVTHAIPPQHVFQGAVCLDECFDAFPTGTIHLVVVDPGVGSARKRIGVEIGNQHFVGPDNGLLSLVSRRHPIHRVHELTEPRFHRESVSSTFHGRDVFAPVAAHWSLGTDLSQFGPPVTEQLCQIVVPQILRQDRAIEGQIIAIDHFGNLISNIAIHELPMNCSTIVTEIRGQHIRGLNRFYAERSAGELIAVASSSGRLEIAQNGGAANQILSAALGTPLRIKW